MKKKITSRYFSLRKLSYYHQDQSGIETQVFLEYLSLQLKLYRGLPGSVVENSDIAMTTYFADNGVLHCSE